MDVTVSEFPFVSDLPKREAKAIKTIWDQFEEVSAIVQERGAMLPPASVAVLFGLSKQRIFQFIAEGRFNLVEFNGKKFICEDDIIRFAETERKCGRPCGPTSIAEAAKVAIKAGREASKNSSK